MKRILITGILFIIIAIVVAGWWTNGLKAVNENDNSTKIFVIKQGEGVREIANDLKEEGLIRDPIVFFLQTKRLGIDKEIEAGDFRLSPSMTTTEIAQNLTHGMLDIWVTITEGKRAEEVNELLKEKMPQYEDNWRTALITNEGYLFPDTYLLPRDASIDSIISIFRTNFDKKFQEAKTGKTSNYSDREILTIASLIEREAANEKDRPMVASVILNRLGIGMKLDIDATIQYALGYQKEEGRWWKRSLTATDKALNSQYNTYKVNGLPPSPISNPGLASLKAAFDPAETDYLYYFTDKNGINHYSKSLEEHETNIVKFGL